MVRAMGAAGAFNIDTSRFYREALPPDVYLTSSYYRKWFLGLEDLLIAKGYIAAEEVAAGHAVGAAKAAQARQVHASTMSSASWCAANSGAPRPRRRNSSRAIACAPGTFIPTTHTRLPRYVRGHVGVVERDHGCQVFPDTAAMEAGENPQWLYTVVFDGGRAMGPGRRSDLKDIHRCVRAVSGAGVMDAAAAQATSAVPEHPPRRRRAGVSRAVGSAGLRDGAGAA